MPKVKPEELVAKIIEAYWEDDANALKESAELYHWYKKLDKASKKIADTVCIRICGWSIETIMRGKVI